MCLCLNVWTFCGSMLLYIDGNCAGFSGPQQSNPIPARMLDGDNLWPVRKRAQELDTGHAAQSIPSPPFRPAPVGFFSQNIG